MEIPSVDRVQARIKGKVQVGFTKLEGLGNDFVLIDDFYSRSPAVSPELAQRMLDRRFGIGGDQLLWLRAPQDAVSADCRMEILNPDGSMAEMCGNGIRAFALYFHRMATHPQCSYRIETLAGVKKVEMFGDGQSMRADMGPPVLGSPDGEALEVLGARPVFYEVNMGNPHAVFFGEDLEHPLAELPTLGAEALGPAVERHPRFPARTNVEFVRVESPDRIRVRVWERGAGLTLACGTGACASAVAAILSGRVQADGKPVRVMLPGGELLISWAGGSSPVFMEGPANEVFRGQFVL